MNKPFLTKLEESLWVTIFPKTNHSGWDSAFARTGLLEQLFVKSKNK